MRARARPPSNLAHLTSWLQRQSAGSGCKSVTLKSSFTLFRSVLQTLEFGSEQTCSFYCVYISPSDRTARGGLAKFTPVFLFFLSFLAWDRSALVRVGGVRLLSEGFVDIILADRGDDAEEVIEAHPHENQCWPVPGAVHKGESLMSRPARVWSQALSFQQFHVLFNPLFKTLFWAVHGRYSTDFC